mgnify:CR=1 FL=1
MYLCVTLHLKELVGGAYEKGGLVYWVNFYEIYLVHVFFTVAIPLVVAARFDKKTQVGRVFIAFGMTLVTAVALAYGFQRVTARLRVGSEIKDTARY